MPDAPDADRRPVPYRREGTGTGETGSLTEAATLDVLFEDNQVSDAPPAEPAGAHRHAAPPARTSGRSRSWAVIVAMLVAAGVLFWSPWRQESGTASSAADPAGATVAAAPSTAPASAGSAGAPQTRIVDGPIVPTHIAIPAIGVDTTVEHRGTVRQKNAFTGQTVEAYGVPTSMRTTSWWSDGPEPGSGQMAVVLGHTQVGGYGVFNKLATLHSGDPVTLRAANGDTLRLAVLGSPATGLDKSTSALADALNGHPAGADVALVTCGGQFDEQAKASEDNIVVFASVVHG